MTRRCALVAFLAVLAAFDALACQGPFSAAYEIRLRPDHQVYVGKITGVQGKEHVATLQVLRAWQKNASPTIVVHRLSMNVGHRDRAQCVDLIPPKVGEEWLVVAYPLNGTLVAQDLMSLNMARTDAAAGVARIKKTRGDGYAPKLCRIGNTGLYIPEHAECIDTQAKCEAKGGVWAGSVSGRGRNIGCDLPTKDAGRKCADSSQCEAICIANDSSNKNCSCYGRTIVPKGPQPDMCSFNGLIRGLIID